MILRDMKTTKAELIVWGRKESMGNTMLKIKSYTRKDDLTRLAAEGWKDLQVLPKGEGPEESIEHGNPFICEGNPFR